MGLKGALRGSLKLTACSMSGLFRRMGRFAARAGYGHMSMQANCKRGTRLPFPSPGKIEMALMGVEGTPILMPRNRQGRPGGGPFSRSTPGRTIPLCVIRAFGTALTDGGVRIVSTGGGNRAVGGGIP